MMVKAAFRQRTDGGFGRNISSREGKSVSRVSVYSSENKIGNSHDKVAQCNQPGAILRACCCPVVMISLFMSPLDNNRSDWEKRMTEIYKIGHLVYLIIKILLS